MTTEDLPCPHGRGYQVLCVECWNIGSRRAESDRKKLKFGDVRTEEDFMPVEPSGFTPTGDPK